METALKDFEEWVKTIPVVEIKYYAVFDPSTGKVSGIYPDHSLPAGNNKIEVEQEIAQSVLDGITTLNSYVVDIEDGKLNFVEIKSLTKIDDVLHRIIDERWSTIDDPDVILTSNFKQNTIKIELSKKFYDSRKIYWDGNTEMSFLFTEYNDPNGLYEIVSFTINDLFENRLLEVPLVLPEEFSVYTRRIFKQYIVRYENS